MARQVTGRDPDQIRRQLVSLLEDFEALLRTGNLREQVLGLVSVNQLLRDLGGSLVTNDTKASARARILVYLQTYLGEVVSGDELMVVAGISEYARRIRELRVQFGWKIVSGMTIGGLAADQDAAELDTADIPTMKPMDYLLVEARADRESAHRWNVANEIRKSRSSVKIKILRFFRENVGQRVSGEELAYLARNASEWARRVRELRTEDGWPIVTKQTGDPELPVGIYVLKRDRQAPAHDRRIKDSVRVTVLKRDKRRCRHKLDGSVCGWHPDDRNADDYRFLELHHVVAHAKGGSNEADNLITVCNVCHDEIHRHDGDDA